MDNMVIMADGCVLVEPAVVAVQEGVQEDQF